MRWPQWELGNSLYVEKWRLSNLLLACKWKRPRWKLGLVTPICIVSIISPYMNVTTMLEESVFIATTPIPFITMPANMETLAVLWHKASSFYQSWWSSNGRHHLSITALHPTGKRHNLRILLNLLPQWATCWLGLGLGTWEEFSNMHQKDHESTRSRYFLLPVYKQDNTRNYMYQQQLNCCLQIHSSCCLDTMGKKGGRGAEI